MSGEKEAAGEAGASIEAVPKSRLDRIFRWAILFVPFGVLGNLALSWYATDHSVLRSLDELPRGYLALAVALGLVPWFTNALRIWIWARFISRRLTFRDAFRITIGAELASSVFPTSSGGEVFRWGMMLQKGITPGQAASIVTLGYLEDLIFFATALPAAVVISRAWELPVLRDVAGELRANALVTVAVAVAVIVAIHLLLRLLLAGRLGRKPRVWARRRAARIRKRLRRTVRDFGGVLRLVRERGKLLFVLTLAITAVQWICRYSVVTALAAFLGAEVDPVLFFLLQWVIFTALVFVPTPGASGGAEAAFLLVYSALLPTRIIGIATAGWRFLTFYLQLALGAVIFALLNLADARDRRREEVLSPKS